MRFLALLLLLSACAATPSTVDSYFARKNVTPPTPESFQTCRGYGCKFIDDVTLSKKEWKSIDRIFRKKSKTPEAERKKIAKAIEAFEIYTGNHTGTFDDIYGTFKQTGFFQHDCVDESTNTTVYLKILEQRGHIKHHQIEAPDTRLPLIHAGRWPHQTAVISEIETSKFFAVDSWFHDNGHPPEIIPLKEWKAGWKPDTILENESPVESE